MSKPIVSFDEEAVKDELRELVRKAIEEAIIEMYLAGVSTRRIEDVSEILWGRRRLRRHGLQSQREGVQGGRRVAVPAADPRLSVRLHRRHLPEALLGRLLRERGGDGGDRRER